MGRAQASVAWTSGDVSTTINMDGVWVTSRSASRVFCEEVHFVVISIFFFFGVQYFILCFLRMHLS